MDSRTTPDQMVAFLVRCIQLEWPQEMEPSDYAALSLLIDLLKEERKKR